MPTTRCRSSPAPRSIAGSSRRRSGHGAGRRCAARRGRQCRGRAGRRPARPTPRRCARTSSRAYTAAVHARHPGAAIIPDMSTGATDGLYFRARGVPVYGVDGSWGVSRRRARPRPRRAPAGRRFYDDVDHWTDMLKALAG